MVGGGVPFEMGLGTHTAALWAFPQVVDIMRVNVDKVLERDQKLSELANLENLAVATELEKSVFHSNL